jgi:hypothetical protein
MLYNNTVQIETLLEDYENNKEQIFHITANIKSQLNQLSNNTTENDYI